MADDKKPKEVMVSSCEETCNTKFGCYVKVQNSYRDYSYFTSEPEPEAEGSEQKTKKKDKSKKKDKAEMEDMKTAEMKVAERTLDPVPVQVPEAEPVPAPHENDVTSEAGNAPSVVSGRGRARARTSGRRT